CHYVNSAYLQTMRGTLVASSYPLNSVVQQWTKKGSADPGRFDPRRITFASSAAEGVYNATLSILADKASNDDKHVLLDKLLEYRHPVVFSREAWLHPFTWISVIDEHGRFTPLAMKDSYDGSMNYVTEDPKFHEGSPPIVPPQSRQMRMILIIVIL